MYKRRGSPAPYSPKSLKEIREMANVAWLGLGVMGYPMAGHLKVRGGNDRPRLQSLASQGRGMVRQIRRQNGGHAG